MISEAPADNWSILILDPSRLERDCALIGLASTAGIRAEAYENVRSVPQTRTPDVLLIRFSKTVAGSSVVANPVAEVTKRWPEATTVVIADDSEAMLESVLCGARAVVTSASSLRTILDVIRVSRSDLYVLPEIVMDLIRDINGVGSIPSPSQLEPLADLAVELPRIAGLTDRQRKVLEHLAIGMSNKQIARELSLSESTVKAHVRAIMDRLGVANRTQIVSRVLGLCSDSVVPLHR